MTNFYSNFDEVMRDHPANFFTFHWNVNF